MKHAFLVDLFNYLNLFTKHSKVILSNVNFLNIFKDFIRFEIILDLFSITVYTFPIKWVPHPQFRESYCV